MENFGRKNEVLVFFGKSNFDTMLRLQKIFNPYCKYEIYPHFVYYLLKKLL